MNEFTNIKSDDLSLFTINMFKAIGCSEIDAKLATDVLIQADLRGIDSHGVARLSGYVRLYEGGRINTKPNKKRLCFIKLRFVIVFDAGYRPRNVYSNAHDLFALSIL